MSVETRDALLYGQLQDGLRVQLMRGPAVSGARSYQELCIAAKNEEKRLADLKKREEYSKPHTGNTSPSQRSSKFKQTAGPSGSGSHPHDSSSLSGATGRLNLKYFYCGKQGHKREDCRRRKRDLGYPAESRGPSRPATTKQIRSGSRSRSPSSQGGPLATSRNSQVTEPTASSVKDVTGPKDDDPNESVPSPLELLFSDSEEEGVRQIRVTDGGSHPRLARVDIHGVPADGIIDTAADITIMGGKLFALVAATAKLRKRNFKKPDKTPRNYNGREFRLDGSMEMDITFHGKTIKTNVYIKMDAIDQLLLSEGVCRQLTIVTYHDSVVPRKTSKRGESTTTAAVPSIRVSLIQSCKLAPSQSALVPVKLDPCVIGDHALLVEGEHLLKESGLVLEDAVIDAPEDGTACVVITNMTGLTQRVSEGTTLGEAQAAEVVTADPQPTDSGQSRIRRLSSTQIKERRAKLLEALQLKSAHVPHSDAERLCTFLGDNHDIFSLEPGERGDTSLFTMEINTGDASPLKQPPRRMPFMVHEEVAKQLRSMQQEGVIRPSNSPWSSPVVLVRKKDGSHRFCVDYRALNSVTKADTFPLPCIDDLLDQLSGARYFSTLDLASGFWQIQMETESREKTAFATPQGLYEFLVMPFGLKNAPAVFQRLMQRVFDGLNPEGGKQFLAVYLDDILVFSTTLEEHLAHLRKVIDRLQSANLKLKPSKCRFMKEEVEYLGHIVTAEGLRPNARVTEAVQSFPTP